MSMPWDSKLSVEFAYELTAVNLLHQIIMVTYRTGEGDITTRFEGIADGLIRFVRNCFLGWRLQC